MAEQGSDFPAGVVVSPGWASFYESTRIPAARRVGNRLWVTGHTGDGPDGSFSADARAQLRQTFGNLERTLRQAGARWSDVTALTSFHVGLRSQSAFLLEVAAGFLSDPYPAWTAVGVSELFEPPALVEISCEAVLGNEAGD